jgi:hypothetical protein
MESDGDIDLKASSSRQRRGLRRGEKFKPGADRRDQQKQQMCQCSKEQNAKEKFIGLVSSWRESSQERQVKSKSH